MALLNKVKLGDIADVLNGVSDTRQSVLQYNKGTTTYSIIQPNNLGDFNEIQGLTKIARQAVIDESYFIRKNDILLKRLNPDTATLITIEMPYTTFSSNLFIIRALKGYYPAYIACLLENGGLAWLNSNIIGSVSAIKTISIKALKALEIPIIEYKKQKIIGQMWLLYKKKKQLLNQLIIEDRRLMAAVMNSVVSNDKEGK